jgi:RpiB/LacA/LacB family sugar-phosphate isomerase
MRVASEPTTPGTQLKEHLIATLVADGHDVGRLRHRLHRVRRLPADLRRRRAPRRRRRADRGIVLGGSGQGEQIAANKVHGVRAALCNDLYTARLSREHNDANVLAMGGRIVATVSADEILGCGWRPPSKGGRHHARSIRSPRSRGSADMSDPPPPPQCRLRRAAASAAYAAPSTVIARSNRASPRPPAPSWRTASRPEAHRQRELRVSGRAAHDGHVAVGQVRRGHDRPPVLRRCQNIDIVEQAAVDHAEALFGAPTRTCSRTRASTPTWSRSGRSSPSASRRRRSADLGTHVNDLSDTDWEELRLALGNQRALGMSLDAGGHLTPRLSPEHQRQDVPSVVVRHRSRYRLLDYAAVRATALEFCPLVLIAGYSAYPRKVNFATMREIADEVGAVLMVDMAHFAGLVAGKVFTGDFDPVPHAHVTTTTTHKSLRGPARGHGAVPAGVRRLGGPRLPDGARRPLGHVMAAKAVALAEARRPRSDLRPAVADNAVALADGLCGAAPGSSPAAPRTTSCSSTCRPTASPAGRPSRRSSTPDRHEPQRHPARPERRLVHSRRAHRHARAHHPRLRRRRLRPGGRAHGRRALGDEPPARRPPPSQAKYTIADGVADKAGAAAELLDLATRGTPALDL